MVKNLYTLNLQLKVDDQLVESVVPIDNKVQSSLYKKSKNSGIPINILEEVYLRGYNLWNENFKGTREQFAFDRVNSFIAGGFAADLDKDLLNEESLHDWFSKSKSKSGVKGWVQVGGKYSGEPCARQPGQKTTPKCRSSREAARMTKKEKEYAFRKKQEEDPNQPQKSGAARPTNVKTYKEEKDACYHKVKARYKVFPSAYACVPEETSKALTKDGWKSVDMLNIDDEILTINIEKEILEFKPILKIHRYKKVPTVIVQCGNTGYIFESTLDHKWVVKLNDAKSNKKIKYDRINGYSFLTTQQLLENKTNKKILTTAPYKGGSILKKDKIFKYGDNWVKYILDISEEQRQSWLFSSIVYDGNQIKTERILEKKENVSDLEYIYSGNHGKQSFGFKQKDIMHRDAFLLSAYLNGGAVSWKKHKTKEIYSCHYVSNKNFKNINNIKKINDNINDVWCPETENNTWVMMQETNNKGIITVTGNSGALVKCRKKGASNWGNKTVKEEILNKKVMTPKEISKHFDVPLDYVKDQLKIGMKVEKEHTSDSITAKRIALAHLSEKPDYYKKLKKVGLEEKLNYEKHTKDPNKSSSRFDASDELVLNYKKTTPEQSVKENVMKMFLEAKKKTEVPIDKDIMTSARTSLKRMSTQATTGEVPKTSKAKSLKSSNTEDPLVSTLQSAAAMQRKMPSRGQSRGMGLPYEIGPDAPYHIKDEMAKRYAENRQKEANKPKTMWGKIKRMVGLGEETLEEIAVRDIAGNKKPLQNVPIRMADGTIKKLPPGKSGSSGGGGNGAESGLDEAKTPAWQRKEGKDPKGGLNKKGVASYRAQNPGSKLQTAVTTEPSKLKKGSKKAKRRLSFCRRMKGMKAKLTSAKKARDPDSRINKSLRKWNC
jgi:hypothetical protein